MFPGTQLHIHPKIRAVAARVRIPILLTIVAVAAAAATVARWSAQGHVHPFWMLHFYDIPFEQEAWKNNDIEPSGGYTARMRMICDFLTTHRMIGMRRHDVVKLLGPKTESRIVEGKPFYVYELEYWWQFDDYHIIEFEFNEPKNGVVTAVRVEGAGVDSGYGPVLWERTAGTPWGGSRPAAEK
ncbi:MAG: hypothetical protein HY286_05350 [Planctomycetes bacterium]|nr:hypothetical protein [Planctomycetota bacterium]